MSVDPLAEKYPRWSPYNYTLNNPLKLVDPDGMEAEDWVEGSSGKIYWDNNATSQATTKKGETYLGKNVLVATHNRDSDLNEPINSAQFDLYLESNKNGPTASIYGNTIPADVNKYGTLKEGLYPAKSTNYHGDIALRLASGGDLPTVNGNPNNKKNYKSDGSLKPTSEHIMSGILFHKGNYARTSLYTLSGKAISKGCQTGGCGPGSLKTFRTFGKNLIGFNGNYYLRNTKTLLPNLVMPVDNTYVKLPIITNLSNITLK